ncbi:MULTISPECIES: hypothetical protein [unclassified Bradyrhizobium]|uniref:hypothetical protein n=1 Tax=unclassified Bradyrhizobium TaxID=2631580 RepID=UPI0024797E7C|nr:MULTISPECIES: hypothetical protein [unclassified Bradyrhizobium]WGS19011.1 hypothetical protein MTX22_31615 [Bradyrhizobium sp. ISRA463]WGS25846.1 hypothetical protein MTX19_29180 [Bradyrhizobium sp. ISRA464]
MILSTSNDERHRGAGRHLTWERIETAPFDRVLEIAVIEGNIIHRLVFPCRRSFGGWIKVQTGERVAVQPTHWRVWCE